MERTCSQSGRTGCCPTDCTVCRTSQPPPATSRPPGGSPVTDRPRPGLAEPWTHREDGEPQDRVGGVDPVQRHTLQCTPHPWGQVSEHALGAGHHQDVRAQPALARQDRLTRFSSHMHDESLGTRHCRASSTTDAGPLATCHGTAL
jgi:hypothetical protein